MWPVRFSTPSSEHSSSTCSTSSGPRHRQLLKPWTTRDLAAHLVLREHDHLAGPGLVLPGAWGRFAERRRRALASRDFSWLVATVRVGTAARLLPHRVGAPVPEPQRVLRPPRGRTQSQRSWSSNERARDGRGPVAQRQSRVPVPRPPTAWCRTRASVGGDRRHRSSTARGTRRPHRRTSGRAAALPLRATGRGAGRGGRACRGTRSGPTRAVRHVTRPPTSAHRSRASHPGSARDRDPGSCDAQRAHSAGLNQAVLVYSSELFGCPS